MGQVLQGMFYACVNVAFFCSFCLFILLARDVMESQSAVETQAKTPPSINTAPSNARTVQQPSRSAAVPHKSTHSLRGNPIQSHTYQSNAAIATRQVQAVHARSAVQQPSRPVAVPHGSTHSLRGIPLPDQSHTHRSNTAASANATRRAQAAPTEKKAIEIEKYKRQLENDRKFAEQHRANVSSKDSRDLAERQMMTSPHGKAWNFVNAVVKLHKEMEQTIMQDTNMTNTGVTMVEDDALVWLVVRMIKKQQVFKAANIPTTVDLGYHWTQLKNMKMIKKCGLLSERERNELRVQAQHNRSTYGDGIYTSDSHTSHRNSGYGPVCLLVARLKGTTSNLPSDHHATFVNSTNTIVKLPSSDQCVPLLQLLNNQIADRYVTQYQRKVQSIIDSFFSEGFGGLKMPASTAPIAALPRTRARPAALVPNPFTQATSAVPIAAIKSRKSASSGTPAADKTLQYVAPQVLGGNAATGIKTVRAQDVVSTTDCVLCFDPLKGEDVGRIVKCGHEFHESCLLSAMAHSSQCPLCKKNINGPQGKMPDGRMLIRTKSKVSCGGFPQHGSIEIIYTIPSGTQKQYHP